MFLKIVGCVNWTCGEQNLCCFLCAECCPGISVDTRGSKEADTVSPGDDLYSNDYDDDLESQSI